MLAQLAATLRGRQGLGGGVQNLDTGGGERATVVLDDNCLVCYT